ncbi:MAG TPA: hypothetical protein VIF57_32250 [Polyangia bacterium]|jgi:hypothetical protein
MNRWTVLSLGAALSACASTSTGYRQEGRLANNAPADRPVHVRGTNPEEALANWRRQIAPYVAKATATYPSAKQRYLAGLPAGETFFVTTLLRDRDGHFEQVFVLVDRIAAGAITGRISSDIAAVRGYRRGDVLSFPESEVVDWLISKPDGSEEGNFVGKYLDTLQQPVSPAGRQSI